MQDHCFTVAIGYLTTVYAGYTASASALPSSTEPGSAGSPDLLSLCDCVLRNWKLYLQPTGAVINLPAYPQSESTSETVFQLSFPLANTERTILNPTLALSEWCSIGTV